MDGGVDEFAHDGLAERRVGLHYHIAVQHRSDPTLRVPLTDPTQLW